MLNVDFTALARPTIEDLTSQVDGSNTVFTTGAAFEEVLRLFLNGQLLKQGAGEDYTWTAPNTITMAYPPRVHPLDGKARFVAEYV